MLSLNAIDAAYDERDKVTSSGAGKTLTSLPVRVCTMLTKLYDLSVTSGVFFKHNAIRENPNVTTCPYVSLNHPGSTSGILVPIVDSTVSKGLRQDYIGAGEFELPKVSAAKAAGSGLGGARKQEYVEEIVAVLQTLMGASSIEQFSSKVEPGVLYVLTEQQFNNEVKTLRYGSVNSRGIAINACDQELDDLCQASYFLFNDAQDGNDFLFTFGLSRDTLYPENLNDTDGFFSNNVFGKFGFVAFKGHGDRPSFKYNKRPPVTGVLAYEGCCHNVRGGSRLVIESPDEVFIKEERTLCQQIITMLEDDGSDKALDILGHFKSEGVRYLLSLDTSTLDLDSESSSMAKATIKDLKPWWDAYQAGKPDADDLIPEDFKGIPDLEEVYRTNLSMVADGIRGPIDALKKLVLGMQQLQRTSAHCEDEFGTSGYDIAESASGHLTPRRMPFDVVDDVLDYEGPLILETIANLFFVSAKGDSLGASGYSNKTLSGLDGNTYGGMISEWASRGKNDPEQTGMLRAILGGDFLFKFTNKQGAQKSTLTWPIRATHRCKDGDSQRRETVHDVIVEIPIFKINNKWQYKQDFSPIGKECTFLYAFVSLPGFNKRSIVITQADDWWTKDRLNVVTKKEITGNRGFKPLAVYTFADSESKMESEEHKGSFLIHTDNYDPFGSQPGTLRFQSSLEPEKIKSFEHIDYQAIVDRLSDDGLI